VSTADGYVEYEPTVPEWFKEHAPTGRGVLNYFISLFPFIKWITKYNFIWLTGDLIAGKSVSEAETNL
jgi:sodium-independent sulfate anion transporter 11